MAGYYDEEEEGKPKPRKSIWVDRIKAKPSNQFAPESSDHVPVDPDERAVREVAEHIVSISTEKVRGRGKVTVTLPVRLASGGSQSVDHTNTNPDENLPTETIKTTALVFWLDKSFIHPTNDFALQGNEHLDNALPDDIMPYSQDIRTRVEAMRAALQRSVGIEGNDKVFHAGIYFAPKPFRGKNEQECCVAVVLATDKEHETQLLRGAQETLDMQREKAVEERYKQYGGVLLDSGGLSPKPLTR